MLDEFKEGVADLIDLVLIEDVFVDEPQSYPCLHPRLDLVIDGHAHVGFFFIGIIRGE
jgi:hypothetical protein